MKVMSPEESDLRRSELTALTKATTIIVTKKGAPVFSIRRLSKDDRERLALATNPQFQAILERSRRSYRAKGGITMDELCAQHGLRHPATKTRRRVSAASVKSKR